MRLLNRVCNVTILHPSPNDQEYFKTLGGNQLTIRDHRMTFEITKDLGKHPNQAKVVITNLARKTRAEIEKKPIIVRIDAGHDGGAPGEAVGARHLFTGNLRYGWSQPDGTDWKTTLELGDGDRAYRNARVSMSYKQGTPTINVVRDCMKAMGLELPSGAAAGAFLQDLRQTLPTGDVLDGAAADELTRLLAPYGYHWSIQDGKFLALKDEQVRPDQAVVVSQGTGMIGSPEFGAPHKKGQSPTLTVRMILYPGLVPGTLIMLKARDVQGLFKVIKLSHSGDTHGDEWTTKIQCKPR